MRKIRKMIGTCLLLAFVVWMGSILADRVNLRENLIRLHVVANSDSEEDQKNKLLVRDCVTQYLADTMDFNISVGEAKCWIANNLDEMTLVCNTALQDVGSTDRAVVTLEKESFDTRYYDTFSLPAGVYDSLRITIGNGEGKNWWCVVFPSLCIPATSEGFHDTAVGAGFPRSLSGSLSRQKGYEVRFYFLDCLGRLENLWFRR